MCTSQCARHNVHVTMCTSQCARRTKQPLLTGSFSIPGSSLASQRANCFARSLISATVEKVVVSVRDITKMKESLYLPVNYELGATSDGSITIFTRGGCKYCDVTLMRELG